MIMRIVLFTLSVLAMAIFGLAVHATDYFYPAPVPVPPPPVIIDEGPPPPAVVVPRPREHCHTVRTTKHDDILDSDDWEERDVCD